MKFKTKELGDGIMVVTLVGRFNLVTAQSFRDKIKSLVELGSIRVVVDLSEVTSFDSSALGALIGGLKATREVGGDLRLASPTEQVNLVLRLTNMERVLICHDKAEEAFRNG
jgi:anti-sigma B factor antagonist